MYQNRHILFYFLPRHPISVTFCIFNVKIEHESYNALLIEQKHPQGERLIALRQMAVRQLQVLSTLDVSGLPQLPITNGFQK